MKKSVFVLAIVAVLVFAFAATAMAASGVPNRSSAFLGTTTDRVNASGGTKAGYITWTQANTAVSNAATAYPTADTTGAVDLMLEGPHSNYAMGTVKCQVCHSAHKALITGNKLTMGTDAACVTCHGAGSPFSSTHVAAGSYLDARHGASCSYCHTQNPHGMGVSEYGVAASALLINWVDPMLEAAIDSASSGVPEVASYPAADWEAVDGWHLGDMTVEIYQPGISATNQEAIESPSSAAEVAIGRAIATGYVCTQNGCHMNGSFNGLTNDASFGEFRFSDNPAVGDEDGAPDGAKALRTDAIKGHTLYAFAGPTGAEARAWAVSSTCRSCHDQPDPRLGGAPAFPHSNAYWVADAAATGLGGQNGGTYIDGYTKQFNTAAWFMLAENVEGDKVPTNTRQVGTTATRQLLTVAMDGACLKCHASSVEAGGPGVSF